MRIAQGAVEVEISTSPLAVTVRRGGRRLVAGAGVRVLDGEIGDQFVQWTEGVLAHEDLADPVGVASAQITPLAGGARLALRLHDGSPAELTVTLPGRERVTLELTAERRALRLAYVWPRRAEEAFTGLGARHGLHVDQADRLVQLGADRRYTGPDCPPDMLDVGGIPQGDYAPVPFLSARAAGLAGWRRRATARASSWATSWPSRRARAPGRCACTCSASPPLPRGCGRSCAPPAACRRCCRNGATGTGRAATSTPTSAMSRRTSRATASTGWRSTRSCSTRPGRRSTTPGSSTPTSSPTPPA